MNWFIMEMYDLKHEFILEMTNTSENINYNSLSPEGDKLESMTREMLEEESRNSFNNEEDYYSSCKKIANEMIKLWFKESWVDSQYFNQEEFWSRHYNLDLHVQSIVQMYFERIYNI